MPAGRSAATAEVTLKVASTATNASFFMFENIFPSHRASANRLRNLLIEIPRAPVLQSKDGDLDFLIADYLLGECCIPDTGSVASNA